MKRKIMGSRFEYWTGSGTTDVRNLHSSKNALCIGGLVRTTLQHTNSWVRMKQNLERAFAFLTILATLVSSCRLAGEQKPSKPALIFSAGSLDPLFDEVIRIRLDDFARQQNLTLVYHPLPPNTDLQRTFYLRSFTAESRLVDVFLMDVIWTGELAGAGTLSRLDNLLGSVRRDAFPLDFLPGIEQACRYDGKLYGIPLFLNVGVLFYRKDLVEKPGSCNVPVTLEHLASCAVEIAQQQAVYGYVFQGADYEGLTCSFLELYWSFGGTIGIGQNSVTLDPEAIVQSLRYMRSLIDRGATPEDVLDYTEEETLDLFASGKAAFMRGWNDMYRVIQRRNPKLAESVGIIPLPGTTVFQHGVGAIGGWLVAINHNSTHVSIATKLAAYLTVESKGQLYKEIADKLGGLPPFQLPWLEQEKLPIDVRVGLKALRNARARPASPYYHQFSKVLRSAVRNVLTRKMSPEQAAGKLIEKARDLRLQPTAGPSFPRTLLEPSTVF